MVELLAHHEDWDRWGRDLAELWNWIRRHRGALVLGALLAAALVASVPRPKSLPAADQTPEDVPLFI